MGRLLEHHLERRRSNRALQLGSDATASKRCAQPGDAHKRQKAKQPQASCQQCRGLQTFPAQSASPNGKSLLGRPRPWAIVRHQSHPC